MKSALTALLAICLCLPLMGDDAAKKKFEETKAKAEKGDKIAQFNLGVMYENGQGVQKDFKEAEKWWRKAAEQGEPYAQTSLGVMFERGDGVPKDDKEAVKWYRKAAEQGYAMAQYNLGLNYATGSGVLQDYVTAYAWANIAAANGQKNATKLKSEFLEKKMTADQIAKAEALAKAMIAKNPKLLK
ncbi:MAG: hypothetical protein CMO74_08675 [Verrucomicrobiales bacterium]|nr:hypothetical protein [Verrucomicrobiales bacterium]